MNPSQIKKLAIPFILLVIANIVLGVLVSMGFAMYLLLQDPYMAAIPAAIALPGFLLQPWYLLLLFFPPGYVMSPIIASAITLGVYSYLNQKPWFRSIRRKFPKLRPIQWLWTGFIIISAACGLIFARFKDIPPIKTGIAKGSPYALRSIAPDVAERGRFYQLPSFLDTEALWQVKVDPNQLEEVVQDLGMDAIAVEQFPQTFDGMPPYWWQPKHHSTTRYFSTPEFPDAERGQDGSHAIALWNPGDQLFYLWVKDNF